MKLSFVITMLLSLVAMGANADKPEWAGKGKPTAEQKAAHKAAMNAKEDDDDEDDEDGNGKGKDKAKKEKMKKDKRAKKEKHDKEGDEDDSDRQAGLEKQKSKKSEQEQKELDKGSDRGKEARETRRKWWQFWGSEE
jgi:hypothetical protein